MGIPLIPYQRFDIWSPLRPDDVAERLSAAVERNRWSRLFGGGCPFAGEVEGDTFRLRRVIRYHNSFLPRVRGRIEPAADGGSRLVGTMTLNPAVGGFLVLTWLMAVMIGIGGRWRDPGDVARLLGPAMIFGFSYLLATCAFGYEAWRAGKLLDGLVNSKSKEYYFDDI